MSAIQEFLLNKKPRVRGLADDVHGGTVTITQTDGTVNYVPGTIWEALTSKDLHYDRLVKDLRYAYRHGLPDLTVNITRAENEALHPHADWRR